MESVVGAFLSHGDWRALEMLVEEVSTARVALSCRFAFDLCMS